MSINPTPACCGSSPHDCTDVMTGGKNESSINFYWVIRHRKIKFKRVFLCWENLFKETIKMMAYMEFLKSHLKASEGTDSFYNSELLPTNPKCFSFREFGPKSKPEGVTLTSVFFVIPQTDQSTLSSVNPLLDQMRNMRQVIANPGGSTDYYF